MSQSFANLGAPAQADSRSVLSIPAFRKLWNSMAFSSFGDWLGLLATTALAGQLAGGSYAKANFAIAGVFIVRLLPAVILGPIAGVIADRFDRRNLMIVCDILRFALYLSIPIVGNYFWLYTATVLVEAVTLFWSPAKEASVPNLIPKNKLESANQVTLLASYGTAPLAAIVFSLLALVAPLFEKVLTPRYSSTADIALYIDALSFLYTAWVVFTIKGLPRGPAVGTKNENISTSLIQGFKFVRTNKTISGLLFGMVGAFFAAGAVIGLARTFVGDLQAGDAAYGVLFGSVFTGLALGISLGPKIFGQFSRRRVFGASLAISSFFLMILSLVTNLVLAIAFVVVLGAFAGLSWVTGFTMIGLEVEDEVRGRTFAFVQSLIRISLVLVLAVAPIVAAAIGRHSFNFGKYVVAYNGAAFTMFGAGVIGVVVGVFSYKRMKDRPTVSLWSDMKSAVRGELGAITGAAISGTFIAFEGGEGSGKTTQIELLRKYLVGIGEDVLVSREPGGTELGNEVRGLLLHKAHPVSPRAEALLFAADRAQHVFEKIKPALEVGTVVITDRYLDSSIAYQGAGRVLTPAEVARISRWATESLTPTLTFILDIPAPIGLKRAGASPDRMESEPLAFHERVRSEFLTLASSDPERYCVIDATLSVEEIAAVVQERVAKLSLLKINTAK